MITYLCSVLIADEKTIFNLDNADHIAVLNFIFILLLNLLLVELFLLKLLRSSNELLLTGSDLLLMSIRPLIHSGTRELRALTYMLLLILLLLVAINKIMCGWRYLLVLSILGLLMLRRVLLVILLVGLNLHLV